jgi:hypothetical protein
MDALTPIQTTFKSVLSADATLGALITGVFNDVPADQLYPYVQIGSGTQRPWHAFGGRVLGLGWNCTVTVHIWSRYQGDIQALAILARVVELLNFATLTVVGYTTAMCELDQARVLVEQVEKLETRHVPAVFRVRVS